MLYGGWSKGRGREEWRGQAGASDCHTRTVHQSEKCFISAPRPGAPTPTRYTLHTTHYTPATCPTWRVVAPSLMKRLLSASPLMSLWLAMATSSR